MNIERVKTHLKEHKEAYIAGSCGIVFAGITALIMKGRYATLQSGVDGHSRVTVHPFNFLSRTGDVVTTVHTGNKGHPGFRVRSLEFLSDYDTQAEVAKIFNISPSMLSSHLNGKANNVNGLHFERIAA